MEPEHPGLPEDRRMVIAVKQFSTGVRARKTTFVPEGIQMSEDMIVRMDEESAANIYNTC